MTTSLYFYNLEDLIYEIKGRPVNCSRYVNKITEDIVNQLYFRFIINLSTKNYLNLFNRYDQV